MLHTLKSLKLLMCLSVSVLGGSSGKFLNHIIWRTPHVDTKSTSTYLKLFLNLACLSSMPTSQLFGWPLLFKGVYPGLKFAYPLL